MRQLSIKIMFTCEYGKPQKILYVMPLTFAVLREKC